jgi:hypothetical protein
MGLIMRLALSVLAVMLVAASTSYAQDNSGNINPRWKKIEIPSIDPNAGLTARLGADQSNYWRSPDQSSIGRSTRSWNDDQPTFGITISRPFDYH